MIYEDLEMEYKEKYANHRDAMLEASRKYDEKFEQVKVRLPIGSREKLKKFLNSDQNTLKDKDGNKVNSVNKLVHYLFNEQLAKIGESLDD